MDIKKFEFIHRKRLLDMRKTKKFDCVRMKWDIQQQIQKEYAGLSDQEAHRIQMEKVMQNPILGPFLKRVRSARRILTK
jgi:hypothetical protein